MRGAYWVKQAGCLSRGSARQGVRASDRTSSAVHSKRLRTAQTLAPRRVYFHPGECIFPQWILHAFVPLEKILYARPHPSPICGDKLPAETSSQWKRFSPRYEQWHRRLRRSRTGIAFHTHFAEAHRPEEFRAQLRPASRASLRRPKRSAAFASLVTGPGQLDEFLPVAFQRDQAPLANSAIRWRRRRALGKPIALNLRVLLAPKI